MKNKHYRIKGNSPYFRHKYGTPNPIILIEGLDTELWTEGWAKSSAVVCYLYANRMMTEKLPLGGKVYYGHIEGLGELVHETELGEEIEEQRTIQPAFA